MKKIVFILLIFCSFLVVWGCNKNKTKCVPQKEATSDSSMRSNDDTLSLMIEHEVDDVDYGVIIKRGDKTIHRFGYKYPEDDDLVPNEERIDSCLLTDLNFDVIKEDVLFYLGSFGASGTKHFDACVWNPNTEHYDKIEEFKDIPNPKISDKYKCILSRVYVSSAENEYAKYVCTNGHLIKVAELRQYWKGNIYPERDRAVYEEHFIKANVWKRNLKLNQISDFWKPVVPFLALNILMHVFGILILSIMTKLKNSKIFQTPKSATNTNVFFQECMFLPQRTNMQNMYAPMDISLRLPN